MQNPEVIQAKPEDFDRVYPLLQEFDSPHITSDAWKRLFYHPWDTKGENYRGYMIVDGDRVEGFLGYIFSQIKLDSREIKFCNLTSWIVREKFRGRSLELFYPVLKLENHVVTDFSPTPSVLKMFHKRYRFQILEEKLSFIYPSSLFGGSSCKVSFDDELHTDILDEKDARIHQDHSSLKLRHVLVENNDGYCYIVAKNRRYRKFRHLELLYISNPAILAACAAPVMRALCRRYLVFGAMVDNRLLRGYSIPFTRSIPPFVTTIYKASMEINTADITQLYSEKVLL